MALNHPEVRFVTHRDLLNGVVLDALAPNVRGFIVHGKAHSRRVVEELFQSIPAKDFMLHELSGAFESEAHYLAFRLRAFGAGQVVAVGGGAVQDVCKAAAHMVGIPLISLPTLVATDGVGSPVAVLKGDDGKSTSTGAAAPTLIFICQELFRAVPRGYWAAAAGDVIGNLVSVRDCRRFYKDEYEALSVGCELAEEAAMRILQSPYYRWDCPEFQKLLVEAALTSSRAMLASGDSRPCSGAEHLISHSIDALGLAPRQLHGIQVGGVTPELLELHEAPMLAKKVRQILAELQAPSSLLQLDGVVSEKLIEIRRTADHVRPGRQTVLNTLDEPEFIELFSSH